MNTNDNEVVGLKHIVVYYLHHWKLFLGVFLFSFIPAVLYLVYYPKTYEMVARVKIQDDNDLSSGGGAALGDAAGLMKSFGLNGSSGGGINIDDELATFSSHDLLKSVVVRLGLNTKYIKPFSWNYELYEQTLLTITPDSATLASQGYSIEFFVRIDKTGKVFVEGEGAGKKEKYTFTSLPAALSFDGNTFVLNDGPGFQKGEEFKLYMTVSPAGWTADDLADDLKIDTYSDNSYILEFFYKDYEKQRGKDILNILIEEYNFLADSIKDKDAYRTVQFLNSRIENIITELVSIERDIEKYKIKNKMTDIEYDVQFYVDQMKELQSKIIELEAQVYTIKFMDSFINDPANKYNLIPVLMNVQDGEKGGSLTTYNEALIERQRLLQNSKKDNPLLATMDKQLDKMRESVCLTIDNASNTLAYTLKDLKSKENAILNKMGNMPTQEREFLDYKRQQEIYQGVYLVLLQKREEALLKLGKDRDRALIIDAAFSKSRPIAPRKLFAGVGILLLTLIIPVVYLFCKEQYISLKEEFVKTKKS